ncbi:MAG: STAS domain-containing protein [Planctomycetes bacterium]|nr:STAS domain-containing protein [Planctomycetota bacterium]
MKLKTLQQDEDLSCVALEGRLDMMGVQQIEKDFLEATAARRKPTLIDLVDLEFMSSFGLGMLMKCASVLRANNVKVALLNLQPPVKELIEMTKVDQLLPVMDDKQAALEYLRQP